MKTVLHPCIEGADSFEVTLPEEWRESVDGEMLVLSRGERGVGAVQISFAPHLYRAGMQQRQLAELAEHFAAKGATGPVFDRRSWRGLVPEVIGASAGAMQGDWCVHCFALLHRASLVFATYVCRGADVPGELDAAQAILRTVAVRAAASAAA
ncbi:MAG TPA: hypothetical protein VH208_11730 [Myxococcaceae bacterium]|nr:hypothetical protein [Myxococcaceae bacterium]